MVRAFGKACARKLKLRLAFLKAAPTLKDVPTEKPHRRHQLTGDRKGEFAVDLEHPFRLMFEPTDMGACRGTDGAVDVSKVTEIRILEVKDYH